MAADANIFVCSYDHALVKPVGRFWRVIRQNACFGTRKCLFGVQKDKCFSFHPYNRPKPQFWGIFNVFPMQNKNANKFITVSPIITEFGMQSLMRTSKSAVC